MPLRLSNPTAMEAPASAGASVCPAHRPEPTQAGSEHDGWRFHRGRTLRSASVAASTAIATAEVAATAMAGTTCRRHRRRGTDRRCIRYLPLRRRAREARRRSARAGRGGACGPSQAFSLENIVRHSRSSSSEADQAPSPSRRRATRPLRWAPGAGSSVDRASASGAPVRERCATNRSSPTVAAFGLRWIYARS